MATKWITVADAASALGMHEASVRRLVATGRVAARRIDRRTYLIDAESVVGYLRDGRQPERSNWSRRA